MKVLVVTDIKPTAAQNHILSRVFSAYGVKYDVVPVFAEHNSSSVKKVKPDQWLEHTSRLNDKAKAYDKILVCGSVAAAAIMGLEKGITVTKYRGRSYWHEIGRAKRHMMITYPLSTAIKDPEFFRDMCFDMVKVIENDGPMEQPEIEIHLVESREDLSLLDDLHETSYLACDIETTGLSPYRGFLPHIKPEILGIGFCAVREDETGYAIVIPQRFIGREVKKFLKEYEGTLVFWNAKFDIQHLWKKYGRFEFKDLADGMLLGWCLDERPFNRYKHLNLDLMQRIYFDAPPKSVKMVTWLEEYFRQDVGAKVRTEWVEDMCLQHPEKVRTWWRRWWEEVYGEEPNWRGRKVGRDISIAEVLEACVANMPPSLQPAPDKARKEEMWEDMMRYMGEDCYYTARLWPILNDEAAEESKRLIFCHNHLLIPASKALANMEMTGAPVDIPYLEEMRETLEKLLEKEMKAIRKLVAEHTNFVSPDEGFNPNSSDQVKKVLYNAGDEGGLGLAMPKDVGRYAYKREEGEVTTNADTLKVLARQVAKDMPAAAKLINLILSYRVKSKIVGTYINGLLERVDDDGRIRGDFNLHGTATGRLSCSNPNLQNIPDVSHVGYDIRKAYVPSPGWVVLEADYSQLELRVAGLFSQDEVLIQAYLDGADIHQEVAELLFNKPKEEITKYERYLAKCMNFGVVYGRGWKSIATGPEMDNLVENYGKSWGEEEIAAYFAKFQEGYTDLFAWMELLKDYCFPRKYVEGPFGNRRRWPLAFDKDAAGIKRQIVNSPIQGFAAQVTVNALVELDKVFDPRIQQILFTVHDSILCQCIDDPDIIQETGDIITRTMEQKLPQGLVCPFPTLEHAPFKLGDVIEYNIPFVSDVVWGQSWGECKHAIDAKVEPAD